MVERTAGVPRHRVASAVSIHANHDHAGFRRARFVHEQSRCGPFNAAAGVRDAEVAGHEDADASHGLTHIEHLNGHPGFELQAGRGHGRDRGVDRPVKQSHLATGRQGHWPEQLHTGGRGARGAGPRHWAVDEQGSVLAAQVGRAQRTDLVGDEASIVAQEHSAGFDVRRVPGSELKRGPVKREARALTYGQITVEHVRGSVRLRAQHGIHAAGQNPIAVGKHRHLDALAALAAVQLIAHARAVGQGHHVRTCTEQGKRGCAVDV